MTSFSLLQKKEEAGKDSSKGAGSLGIYVFQMYYCRDGKRAKIVEEDNPKWTENHRKYELHLDNSGEAGILP